MPTTPKCDDVMLFSVESIESNPDVSLTHDDLVLMAVLIGGDYDQVSMASYIQSRITSLCSFRMACVDVEKTLHISLHDGPTLASTWSMRSKRARKQSSIQDYEPGARSCDRL